MELRDQVVDKGGVALVSLKNSCQAAFLNFFMQKLKPQVNISAILVLCIFLCKITNQLALPGL